MVSVQGAGPVPRERAKGLARPSGLALCAVLTIVLGILCVGCGSTPSTAPTPVAPPSELPTAVPSATSALGATPTQAISPTSSPSPTTRQDLITEDIKFSGAASVEDLNTLLLGIRTLPGIQDVQGGVQDLLITYDPKLVTHKQIVEKIQSFGYTVKE